jgi:hypothetical protein
LQLRDEADYREYLTFFCTFVAGDEGPFMIVSAAEDIPWTESADKEDLLQRRRQRYAWSSPSISVQQQNTQNLLDAEDFSKELQELVEAYSQRLTKGESYEMRKDNAIKKIRES